MIVFDIILWIFGKIFYLFTEYIDFCDAALTVALIYYIMRTNEWEKVWALALGLLVAIIVFIIFKHRIGFWIISAIYSLVWGVTVAGIAYLFNLHTLTERTFWIICAVVFVFAAFLHGVAKFRPEIRADEAAAQQPKRQEQVVQEQWYDPRIQEMRPISTKPPEAYDTNWKYYSKRYLEADRE